MFIVSVIVWSNCHISQFSHQMFNVSALLLDNALKPATPLINQTLRQFAPLSDDHLFQQVDCWELSMLVYHLMKGPPNSILDRI